MRWLVIALLCGCNSDEKPGATDQKALLKTLEERRWPSPSTERR